MFPPRQRSSMANAYRLGSRRSSPSVAITVCACSTFLCLTAENWRITGSGIHEHIQQKVDGHRQFVAHHSPVKASILLAGCGSQAAPDIFYFLRDVPRRAPARALEEHVLQAVGNAVVDWVFISGADIDPD